MPQRTRTMATRLRRALPLLALLPAAAFAEEQMLLRIRHSQAAGSSDYELLHVQRGDFRPQAPLPNAQGGDLVVIGRDARGRELFRRAVRNPGQLRAEAFDPATGSIVHASDIQTSGGVVEVHVPQSAALASLDLLERPAAATGRSVRAAAATDRDPTPIRRFDRRTLDLLESSFEAGASSGRKASAGAGKAKATAATAATSSGSAWLWQSGPTSSRYDLVLIGDGYRSSDMAKWQADAQLVANGILADPLFAQNKYRMNIRRVDIASIDYGVTEGNITRNSALGTVVGCYGRDRLVCPSETLTLNAVGAVTPIDGRELIVVVANSQIYGGSGGNVAAVTMHPQAIELVLHEIGHTAFKLADEYEENSACNTTSEPSEVNVTMAKTRATAKWGALISASTAVPTPVGYYPVGTVGLFQGAKYCSSGVYRPTEDSRMRTLGRPWYAVNEARANSIFAYYGAAPGNAVTVSGSLAAGAMAYAPSSGASHYSANGGSFKMSSTGPANANFNLALYKWNGSAWAIVAQTTQAGANDSLTYSGTSGYYYGSIGAVSGSGSYTLTYDFPQ